MSHVAQKWQYLSRAFNYSSNNIKLIFAGLWFWRNMDITMSFSVKLAEKGKVQPWLMGLQIKGSDDILLPFC